MSELLLTPPDLFKPLQPINLRNRLFIAGIGLYRNTTNTPWFTPNDILRTISAYEDMMDLRLSRAQTYVLFTEMQKRNILLQRPLSDAPTSPRTVFLTHLGKEALTNTAVQGARYYGMTLKDMFVVPEIVGAVQEQTEFKERLMSQVLGTVPPGVTTVNV